MFSQKSGEIYEIDESEVHLMDNMQLPLKCKPPSSCKKCHGRLHIGYFTDVDRYMICHKCGKKCIDFDINKFLNVQADQ
jgi:hypothetical protein